MIAPAGGLSPTGRRRFTSIGKCRRYAASGCTGACRAAPRSIDLPQRRHIVEDPERSSVGCRHQIVVLHHQIVHRGHWQVQLQRLPVIASSRIRRRQVQCRRTSKPLLLGSSRTLRTYAPVGYAGGDALPGLAPVVRFVDQWLEIIEFVPVDGGEAPFGHRAARAR